MKTEVIFFIVKALLASAYSKNAIGHVELQPGPVKVKQGNEVSLWCKINNYTAEYPLQWHSPPHFTTITENCYFFETNVKYYVIPCTGSPFTWYNLTIMDVQWADKGKYRCHYAGNMGAVDLQVLVPVTDVSMSFINSNSTVMTTNSMADQPLLLRPDITEELTCTTSCAYPAPTISWFENDQPFTGSATINKTESGCAAEKEGQKRTTSTVTVTGKYLDQESEKSIIFCLATNIIGEPNVSAAIYINFSVTSGPSQPARATGVDSFNTVVVYFVVGMVTLFLIVMIGVYRILITVKEPTEEYGAFAVFARYSNHFLKSHNGNICGSSARLVQENRRTKTKKDP